MANINFKNSELGPIPNDWDVMVVDDCCNVFTGGEAPEKYSSSQDSKYQYPIYSNGRECYGYMETYRISKDAVCISSIGENTGDVFFYKGKFTPIIRLKVIVPKDNSIDTKCLYYLLKWNRIDGTKNGGIPNINADDVKGLKFPLPPLPEQRRIAAALSDIDALIDNLDALIDKKRLIKQATMQQLLSGKKRINGFNDKWVEKKLGDCCEVFGRIGFRGYTKNDLVPKGNGAITFSPSNIARQRINYENCDYISWKKYEESPEIKVFNGDILFCKTASIGKCAFIENLSDKATINPQFVVLKNMKCDNKFLYYILAFSDFQDRVKQITGGSTIPTMSQEKLKEQIITFPPTIAEQTAISKILSDMDEEISLLEAKKEKYTHLKQGMMSELLSGRIRI